MSPGTDADDDTPTDSLPEELRQGIRDDYARLAGSSKVPWRENEAARRRYIDAVLKRCVYAVNVANPHKEKLDLEPQCAICCAKLDAAGTADWVITRGERMLVVSEAKQSDGNRGQYQLLAMMEALRIQNEMLPGPFHTIAISISWPNLRILRIPCIETLEVNFDCNSIFSECIASVYNAQILLSTALKEVAALTEKKLNGHLRPPEKSPP